MIEQFEINLFTPKLPKTSCEDPTFLSLVLLVMSSVFVVIDNLASNLPRGQMGYNGGLQILCIGSDRGV